MKLLLRPLALRTLCLASLLVLSAACGDSTGNEDAGTPDTGVLPTDTGVADTGVHPDAATPDLGTPDLGQVDAGEVDAGEVDAGEVDAGEVDAGQMPTTFTAIYDSIIQPRCGCHQGVTHVSGLTMEDRATAYSKLVGADTTQTDCTDLSRVEPGDPQNSTLYLKISGTNCGSRMPLIGGVLSVEQIAQIEAWISAGALDN